MRVESTKNLPLEKGQLDFKFRKLDLKNEILSLDLFPIYLLLTHPKKLGWPGTRAERAIKEYRDFLYISYLHKNESAIVPSEEVDEVWHNHIMDTRKYYTDCMSTFGEILHHNPYLGMDEKTGEEELRNAVSQTRAAYKKELNIDLPADFKASFCNAAG